jgi:ribonuclease P protein component
LRAAAKGRKAATHGLVLQALPRGDTAPARIGFTVTKKIGNAVVRNRTRRRLKEAARLELANDALVGVDLVLIGREATRGRDFRELRDDLRRALRKTGLVAQTAASVSAQATPASVAGHPAPASVSATPAPASVAGHPAPASDSAKPAPATVSAKPAPGSVAAAVPAPASASVQAIAPPRSVSA